MMSRLQMSPASKSGRDAKPREPQEYPRGLHQAVNFETLISHMILIFEVSGNNPLVGRSLGGPYHIKRRSYALYLDYHYHVRKFSIMTFF